MRRAYTAAPDSERCTADTTSMPQSRKADGSEGARCMKRATHGKLCKQHALVQERKRYEHMSDLNLRLACKEHIKPECFNPNNRKSMIEALAEAFL